MEPMGKHMQVLLLFEESQQPLGIFGSLAEAISLKPLTPKHTQRLQNPLLKEYTLNFKSYYRDPIII